MRSPNDNPQRFAEAIRGRNRGIGMLILGGVAIAVCVVVMVLGVGNVLGQCRTTATIDSLDGNHITVSFTDWEGNRYDHVPYATAGLWKNVGDRLLIRYNVDQPTQVHDVASFIWIGVLTALIALLSIPFGLWSLRSAAAYEKRCQAAVAGGHTVTATVCGVYADGRHRVGKPSRWVKLDCLYIENEAERRFSVFTSDRFPNPGHDLQGTVTVYVDPDHTDNYYVDLSTLNATPVASQEEYV